MLENEHHEYREKIRAFALEKIAPGRRQLDREQRFPDEHIKPLADMGLLSMLIPEQYGGRPTDTVTYIDRGGGSLAGLRRQPGS